MKKVLALAMILCLFTMPAIGETVDVSTMSVEELEALRDTIETELEKQGVTEEREIGEGVYVTGVDIKAGKYELSCTTIVARYGGINITVSQSSEDNAESLASYYSHTAGGKYLVELNDGNTLEIWGGNCTIRPYSPIGF